MNGRVEETLQRLTKLQKEYSAQQRRQEDLAAECAFKKERLQEKADRFEELYNETFERGKRMLEQIAKESEQRRDLSKLTKEQERQIRQHENALEDSKIRETALDKNLKEMSEKHRKLELENANQAKELDVTAEGLKSKRMELLNIEKIVKTLRTQIEDVSTKLVDLEQENREQIRARKAVNVKNYQLEQEVKMLKAAKNLEEETRKSLEGKLEHRVKAVAMLELEVTGALQRQDIAEAAARDQGIFLEDARAAKSDAERALNQVEVEADLAKSTWQSKVRSLETIIQGMREEKDELVAEVQHADELRLQAHTRAETFEYDIREEKATRLAAELERDRLVKMLDANQTRIQEVEGRSEDW